MDSMNMQRKMNADEPEFLYKKKTTSIEPVRRMEQEQGFQREERSDMHGRSSPTETYVREEASPADWRNGTQFGSQYEDIFPRDNLDARADRLLMNQRDNQKIQEEERYTSHPVATEWQQPLATPTVVTPLLQQEAVEQRTDITQLPPQMAEFEMNKRRQQEQDYPDVGEDRRGADQALQSATESCQETQPIRLRPLFHVIRDLCLWRRVLDSAVVFSAGLGLMAALSYFSLISIFAYLSLGTLIISGASVIGRQILYTLQQRPGVAHPFQRIMQRDTVLDAEYVHEQMDAVLQPLNRKLVALRNLYLVDSVGQTLKMILFMYALTYVGHYFTLTSLLMVGWVLAFTLPKLYMMFRPQLDRMWNSARRLQMGIGEKFQQQKQRAQQRRDDMQSVDKKVTFEKTEKTEKIQ